MAPTAQTGSYEQKTQHNIMTLLMSHYPQKRKKTPPGTQTHTHTHTHRRNALNLL
jgi:hypothetical protein